MKPYTSKAKKALDLANRLSKKMEYNYVGTEHILAGLLKEGTGVAAEVLEANKVEYNKLIEMIKELISLENDVALADREGYTPRTLQVLEHASEVAERFMFDEIGTEHILLAILEEGDCAASRLLNTLGVNGQKLYTDILLAMGEDPNRYREEMKNRPQASGLTPTLDQYARDLT